MACSHSLPTPDEIEVEVVDVNEYGKHADSIGSPKLHYEFTCPDCGDAVETTGYDDVKPSR